MILKYMSCFSKNEAHHSRRLRCAEFLEKQRIISKSFESLAWKIEKLFSLLPLLTKMCFLDGGRIIFFSVYDIENFFLGIWYWEKNSLSTIFYHLWWTENFFLGIWYREKNSLLPFSVHYQENEHFSLSGITS